MTDVGNASVLEAHRQRLERTIFSRSSGPGDRWVQKRGEALKEAYGGVRTTLRLHRQVEGLKARANEPFELFILGEGNFGKSTLINALVGEDLSPVHFLPATRCFLRFRLADEPASHATVYANLRSEMHDWLRASLGDGQPSEIYPLTRHEVEATRIDELLKEETRRLRPNDGYEQAIFEIERVVVAPRQIALGQLRVVDTQGLNQIFPDDLKELLAQERASSVERLLQWMASSPRGKHLDWEFRRCDAALWLVNAKRVQSAVTRAAMSYFKRYGKASLVVVSNIDAFPGEEERRRVLDAAAAAMELPPEQLFPINGRDALKARKEGDEELARASGLTRLVDALRELHEERGVRVRLMSNYNTLRTLQSDERRALATLHRQVRGVIADLAALRARIDTALHEHVTRAEQQIQTAADAEVSTLVRNANTIQWNDNDGTALDRIRPSASADRLAAAAATALSQANGESQAFALDLSTRSFSLPDFGADGSEAGVTVRIVIRPLPPLAKMPRLDFRLDIKGVWEALRSLVAKFLGFFGNETKKEELARDLRRKAIDQLRPQWSAHVQATKKLTLASIDEQFKALKLALDDAEEKLQAVEGRPLEETADRLERALPQRPVPNIYLDLMTNAFRRRYGAPRR